MDPETDPEAHSADLSRLSVRAGLGLLAAGRGVYRGAVAAGETVVGLCIVGYLIGLGWLQSRPPRRERRR